MRTRYENQTSDIRFGKRYRETGISGLKVWSTGREESQEEESHTGGSGAGQPMDQGEEGTSQTPDVFQSK